MNYFGNLYIVLFHPDDMTLLKNGPSERRKFLDIMISQLKSGYIFSLNQYMKTLEQRNIYLRQIKYENKSEQMLDIWDEKLAEHAQKVWEYRNAFIKKIKEKINLFHMNITQQKEMINIEYYSSCQKKENYIEKLKKNRNLDISRGFTSVGIHRDDFELFINGEPIQIYRITRSTKNSNHLVKTFRIRDYI